ncbi:MAG: ABC transporter permease [Tannerellaceae bacterium]
MNHRDKGLWTVFKRECGRIQSRRLYFGVCIFLPLLCIFFMATIFSTGIMTDLPIGIVDQDNTQTSRSVIRNIDATSSMHVAHIYSDIETARQNMDDKKIYGYIIIPQNFEQDVFGFRSPTISYYYHYALLTVGSTLFAEMTVLLKSVAAVPILSQGQAMGMSNQDIMSVLMPVSVDNHPLFNPALNYVTYLSTIFVFVLLQILIILTTVYVIGIELKYNTSHEWLRASGNNIVFAVFGKLLPYTIMFTIMGIFTNVVLFSFLKIPLPCGYWPVNIAAFLLVISYQCLGLMIFSVFPLLKIIISGASLFGSLGATLAGVTFPVESMPPVIHGLSYIFPIRHFVVIFQNAIYGDNGFYYVWQNYAGMFIYCILAILTLPLLKKELIYRYFQTKK